MFSTFNISVTGIGLSLIVTVWSKEPMYGVYVILMCVLLNQGVAE
jgi:hypothetical protein